MEITGTRELPTDRATVWAALNDPQRLKAAVPGCESLERTGENSYAAVMLAAIGPVRARFRGKLSLVDIVPPQGYTMVFEGEGGPAGFAKGSARVELLDQGATTRLDYQAKAQVGGRIAQVGQRLIDAAAGKLADDFFTAFSAALASGEAATAAGEPLAPSSRAPLWAAAGLIAFMVALVYVLR